MMDLFPVFSEADSVDAKCVDGSCTAFVEVEFGAEVCKCSVLCCPCHCVVVNGFEFGDVLSWCRIVELPPRLKGDYWLFVLSDAKLSIIFNVTKLNNKKITPSENF